MNRLFFLANRVFTSCTHMNKMTMNEKKREKSKKKLPSFLSTNTIYICDSTSYMETKLFCLAKKKKSCLFFSVTQSVSHSFIHSI